MASLQVAVTVWFSIPVPVAALNIFVAVGGLAAAGRAYG
jgi:hypothetical protein